MRDRPIQMLLWEFRETGALIRARCWIEDYVDTRIVMDRVNTAIYRRLFERGVVSGPISELSSIRRRARRIERTNDPPYLRT
jgi:MscS family membrane protein